MRRALADPEAARRDNARWSARLRAALARGQQQRTTRLASLANALAHLDPTQVLGRGYSIVRDADGHVRRSSAGLAPDASLDITFSEGGAEVRVTRKR
jgi:exodeoxyribonuclease VII large subunit